MKFSSPSKEAGDVPAGGFGRTAAFVFVVVEYIDNGRGFTGGPLFETKITSEMFFRKVNKHPPKN